MVKLTTLYVDWFTNKTQYQFSAYIVNAALIFGNLTHKTFEARNSLQYAANRNLLRSLVPILEFFASSVSAVCTFNFPKS